MGDIDNQTTQTSGMRDYMPQEDTATTAIPAGETVSTSDLVTENVEETPTSVEEPSEPFTQAFDPKTLAPELQPAYKQMQADYTRKTQEIAEIRRNAEEYTRNANLIKYLANNPDIAERVLAGDFVQQETVEESDPEIPTDPMAYAEWVKAMAKEEILGEIRAEQEQVNHQRQIDSQIAEAEKIDPRLSDPSQEDFQQIIAGMVLADEAVSSGTKTYAQATKEAVARYDARLKQHVESEMARLSSEAKAKRNPAVVPSTGNVVAESSTPGTMREAAKEFLE